MHIAAAQEIVHRLIPALMSALYPSLGEKTGGEVSGAQAEGATARDAAILANACVNAVRRIMTELLA